VRYDVVTIDTNIFDQNRLRLEGGMLAQLTQFKNGAAQFVLSEIVLREVKRHLIERARGAKESLEKAISKSRDSGVLSDQACIRMNRVYEAAQSPEEAAEQRLRAFLDKTGADIVPAAQADIRALVTSYFMPSAPFESSGKKKNEFPDAIALLSLEGWARANNKTILAITSDGGWRDFAQNSEWIDVEADLATALQMLQRHAEEAERFVKRLLGQLDAGTRPELLQQITDSIADAVSEMDISAEASAVYSVEGEQVELTFDGFEFRDDGKYEFNVVQVGKDRVVANVAVSIDADAECYFAFSMWDSIDKEYVPMGGATVQTEIKFDSTALITIEGDFVSNPSEIEITDVELLDGIRSVDFGQIGMDDEDEHYYE